MKADKRVRRTLFARGSPRSRRDRIAETLRHDPTRRERGPRRRACSRTARSSGSRSACCSCRSRKLLLLDEPVAGMSDDETERTAELFLSLAGKHSLVVVEHDMAFVAKIARKVTVLHEGSVLAEGTLDAVQERSARDRGVPGPLMDSLRRRPASTSTTAAATSCATSPSRCRRARCTVLLGRNGVGKTTLLRTLMGLVPATHGPGALRVARTSPARRPRNARAPGSATCRRGARSSRASRVEENLRHGPRRAVPRRAGARARLRALPGAAGRCWGGAAATSPAASSSSSPSAARWRWARAC